MTFEELFTQYENLKSEHEAVVAKLTDQNQHLKSKVEKLQRMLWGRSSERRLPAQGGPEQPVLFSVAENLKPQDSAPVQEVKGYKRRGGPRQRTAEELEEGILPAHLPRVIDEKDSLPAGVQKEDCQYMGSKVTERLGETPAQLLVIKTVRHVYKHKETGTFYVPEAPRHVLGRCQVDESFLVNMVVKKILYHLPLYRQHQALKLYGIDLPRQNLANWMNRFGGCCQPVAKAVGQLILLEPVVHCDESPFLVGKYNQAGRKVYQSGYLWPVLAPKIGVAFHYRSGRSAQDGKTVLQGFKGTLVSDAYEVYTGLVQDWQLRWQLCMMHVRRNFVEAEKSNSDRAKEALEIIRKLYEVEALAKDLRPDQRMQVRVEQSRPLMEGFHEWLKKTAATPEAISSPLLAQAIAYVYKRWDAACLFLKDPLVPIDNGADERALRPFKLGAKNWLFSSSELGAEMLAVFYTLIGSAMMHGIHPYYYLLDLCQRLEQPGLKATDLVPHNWKIRFYEQAVPEWVRQGAVQKTAPVLSPGG